LVKEIENEFSGLGFEKETRRFHPHLTIGRVKRVRDGSRSDHLTGVLEDIKIGDIGEFQVNEISLMKSDLKPTGAVYTRISTGHLGELDE
jgi:2'-5' RNA ligase